MANSRDLTPQERLAVSRKAIVRYMTQDDAPSAGQRRHAYKNNDTGDGSTQNQRSHWQIIKRAVRAWWQHHPAQLALDLAQPVLGRYAEEKPLQLLAVAAGVGAAAVLLRPWRLVSVSGLLIATLKSSELSGFLHSLLSTKPESTANSKDTP